MFDSRLIRMAVLFTALASVCGSAQAGSALFGTTNIQYLYGTKYADFKDDFSGFEHDDKASVVTLEHFDAWKYGDNFFFIDITNADRAGDSFATGGKKGYANYYGELAPRLSFGKILNRKLEFGPITDVLLSFNNEMPSGPGTTPSGRLEQTYLYGLAVDLKIPGLQFFQFNYYIRNAQRSDLSNGYQITLVWGAPFSIGPVSMLAEGFLDWAWGEDPNAQGKALGTRYEDNLIAAPRLLIDAGKFWGAPGVVQVGTEWQIWHNKYGIPGLNESVPQAMIKWILQ